MKEPPKEAIAAREYFSKNESHELFPVAEKLLINPPLQIQSELNKMWVQIIKNPPKFNNEIANGLAEKIKELMSNNNIKKLLEKQQIEDMQLNPEKYPNKNVAKPIFDLLLEVNECISFPRFHKKNQRERKELSEKIAATAADLAKLIKVNEIDIAFHGCTMNGDLLYIDSSNAKRINGSELIVNIANLASRNILAYKIDTKLTPQEDAIRFVRKLLSKNEFSYGQPFITRVAVITNAIFGTSYDTASITQLKNRVRGVVKPYK